nr:hypothetical protein CJLB15_00014 [Campylobacter phage CJLB-15]
MSGNQVCPDINFELCLMFVDIMRYAVYTSKGLERKGHYQIKCLLLDRMELSIYFINRLFKNGLSIFHLYIIFT